MRTLSHAWVICIRYSYNACIPHLIEVEISIYLLHACMIMQVSWYIFPVNCTKNNGMMCPNILIGTLVKLQACKEKCFPCSIYMETGISGRT